jgi:hypothetical protein
MSALEGMADELAKAAHVADVPLGDIGLAIIARSGQKAPAQKSAGDRAERLGPPRNLNAGTRPASTRGV